MQERIKSPAILLPGGGVVEGPDHDTIMSQIVSSPRKVQRGFSTTRRPFVDRMVAAAIAIAANQVTNVEDVADGLFSSELILMKEEPPVVTEQPTLEALLDNTI